MTKKTEKLQIRVDPETMKILKETGNKGEYVRRIINNNWTEWNAAIQILESKGWKRRETMCACSLPMAMARTGIESNAGESLSAYMLKEKREAYDVWKVPPGTWTVCRRQVREDILVRMSIWVLATEYRHDNFACIDAIDHMGSQ